MQRDTELPLLEYIIIHYHRYHSTFPELTGMANEFLLSMQHSI